ncbi:hypothetical protein ACOSP7_022811 [Xanthoceras sorbifolium]
MIVFSISAKFLAKDPPPRSESSEDDSEYFSYSKSYFSEADSDLSLSSDDDMSKDAAQQESADFHNEKDNTQQHRYCVNILSEKASNYKGYKDRYTAKCAIECCSWRIHALLPKIEQESGSYCHLGCIEIQGSD